MNTLLSILVIAAIALVLGAGLLLRKGGSRKQAVLMVIVAAILVINVLIWTVPDGSGEAPVDKVERLAQ